jgi:hypothetical protein
VKEFLQIVHNGYRDVSNNKFAYKYAGFNCSIKDVTVYILDIEDDK